MQTIARNNAILSWEQLCNVTSPIPITYVITAAVSSGAIVYDSTLTVVGDEDLSLPMHMEEYACWAVNYTVSLYGYGHAVSIVATLPACMETKIIYKQFFAPYTLRCIKDWVH